MMAIGFWDAISNLSEATAATIILLCVFFWFYQKKGIGTNGVTSDNERRAEERGEIRIRLTNLEAMKGIMEKNQDLVLQFAKDNLRLTELFLQEVGSLKSRVEKLESRR